MVASDIRSCANEDASRSRFERRADDCVRRRSVSLYTYDYPGGCLLSAAGAGRLLRASNTLHAGVEDGKVMPRSGNLELDYALAQTLGMLVDTFQVFPKFAFLGDFGTAYATPGSFFSQTDGTVLFGMGLLNALFSWENHPEIAVATVCAHEFGHIVQFKNGLIDRLQGSASTVRPAELHADFLAGYFAGMRKLARPSFPAVVFATTQSRFGDYEFGRPEHHGTADERATAVARGFHAAYRERLAFSDAIKIGISYVQSV